MTITVRPAEEGDLDEIWALVERAVADMNRRGNPQWRPGYPARSHYAGALAEGGLYAAEDGDGRILGCAVFNTQEEPAYAAIPWSVPGPAMVIHKLAVDPAVQRRGVASALFARCEDLARQQGIASLRIDTYSLNDRMQALIRRQGFTPTGAVHFPINPLPYPCFEKVL